MCTRDALVERGVEHARSIRPVGQESMNAPRRGRPLSAIRTHKAFITGRFRPPSPRRTGPVFTEDSRTKHHSFTWIRNVLVFAGRVGAEQGLELRAPMGGFTDERVRHGRRWRGGARRLVVAGVG